MTTLIYTLIFLGVLCVGTCLGFFLAGLFRIGVNDKEIISQQAVIIDNLSKKNDELTNRLEEIRKTVDKYFPGNHAKNIQ